MDSFEEFWSYYVCEHLNPWNRVLHFMGTACAISSFSLALIYSQPLFLFAALFPPYLIAWAGHFLVERNRPATFKYPLRSLMADYKMFFFMCCGKMAAEVERCQAWQERRKQEAAQVQNSSGF